MATEDRRRRKRREVDVGTLVRLYAAGYGLRALVTESGVAYGTVRARLLEAGVELRGVGRHAPSTLRARGERA